MAKHPQSISTNSINYQFLSFSYCSAFYTVDTTWHLNKLNKCKTGSVPIDPKINFRKTTVLRLVFQQQRSTPNTGFKKKQKYFTCVRFHILFSFIKKVKWVLHHLYVCIKSCINMLSNAKLDMRRSSGFPSWSSSRRRVCHMEAVDWRRFSSHIYSAKRKMWKRVRLAQSPKSTKQHCYVLFVFI